MRIITITDYNYNYTSKHEFYIPCLGPSVVLCSNFYNMLNHYITDYSVSRDSLQENHLLRHRQNLAPCHAGFGNATAGARR